MKKILLLILLVVANFQGFSQTPGISYQAVILNPNTKELPGAHAQTSILANRKVAIRFTIINESFQQEYQEYHQTNTDAYGMINLLIGHGTRIGASYFEDILWNGLSKKLKVDIDFSGSDNNYTLLSEQELTFMPQPALDPDYQAILDNTASIVAEVTRATNAESVIQSNVDANKAASILADDLLQINIDAVQADVDANEVASISADTVLKANIDANETASILADTTLQANIDTVQTDVDANEASTTTAIAAIQTDVDNNEVATQTALGLKVDKVSGKGLSTEDYTTTEKTKLGAITGTNTGDQDISGIAINSSNIGDLTSLTTTDKSSAVGAINELGTSKANINSPTFTGTVSGIDKGMVGLGNVNNTSDVDKPVSDATQTALGLKVDKVSGKGLSTEDYTTAAKTKLGAITGSNTGDQDISGIAINSSNIGDLTSLTTTNKSSAVGAINELGTSKANINSPTFTGTVSGIDKGMVGLGNVNNTSDVDKPVSDATQTALNLKANLASPTFTGTPLAPTATAGTNTTQIATTAFVTNAVNSATAGDFVDLTTDQTIAGVKTFSSDAEINGVTVGRGNFNENSNTAIGLGTLSSNNAGYANTGIGRAALTANVSGSGNTALGYIALSNNISGTDNVAIGTQALETNTIGSENTVIGKHADVATDGISNSVAIGANAIVTASNTIQLGSDGSGSHTAITNVKTSGNITAASYIKSGGTSSQFLMADGSVSSGPSGVMSGSGTLNYLPKFTDTSTLGNSNIFDSGTNVGIGTDAPSSKFQIGGEGNFDLNLKFDASNNEMSLKYGFRAQQWRLKTSTNSGVLTPFVFSHYDGTTDNTRLTITNNSVDVPNNLNITGNTIGSNASFFGNLLVNTNQLSVNGTTNRVGIFTDAPTSMFQIGGDGSHDNQLKYDYGGDQGYLKFAFRNNEFRMHSQSESGVLDNLIFTYFDDAASTNLESMRISRTGLVTIKDLRISGGSPATGNVLTSDANGTATWVAPASTSPVREVADEFSATASQTSFTLTQTPSANSKVKMYVNGVRISNTAYSVSGTTLTYVPLNNGGNNLSLNDRIQFDYYY